MKIFYFTLLFLLHLPEVNAQESVESSNLLCKFPISVGFQFQNFALPFKDFNSNFTHPGLLFGTEFNLNKRKSLVQQFNLGGYSNKEMGDGFLIYSQTAFRLEVFKHFYPEIKIGAGWLRSYHPVNAYRYEDGKWSETPGGKSQLILPVGIGIEYNNPAMKSYLVPYLDYQIVPNLFYNDIIPLSFYTIIQAGVRIHLKHK